MLLNLNFKMSEWWEFQGGWVSSERCEEEEQNLRGEYGVNLSSDVLQV